MSFLRVLLGENGFGTDISTKWVSAEMSIGSHPNSLWDEFISTKLTGVAVNKKNMVKKSCIELRLVVNVLVFAWLQNHPKNGSILRISLHPSKVGILELLF